jgi:hypothetical protein
LRGSFQPEKQLFGRLRTIWSRSTDINPIKAENNRNHLSTFSELMKFIVVDFGGKVFFVLFEGCTKKGQETEGKICFKNVTNNL